MKNILKWKITIILFLICFFFGCSKYIYSQQIFRNILHVVSFKGIVYGNKEFVIVGSNGTILTFTNGKKWTQQKSGVNSQLNGITYGDKEFVAVGYNGTIFTSTDGKNWIPQNLGIPYYLNGITYGNKKFVTVGDFSTILTSIDGKKWIPQKSGIIPPKIPLPKSSSQPLMVF